MPAPPLSPPCAVTVPPAMVQLPPEPPRSAGVPPPPMPAAAQPPVAETVPFETVTDPDVSARAPPMPAP